MPGARLDEEVAPVDEGLLDGRRHVALAGPRLAARRQPADHPVERADGVHRAAA